MSDETVEVYDLMLVHQTSKAYLVRNTDKTESWIPISQVEHIEFGKDTIDEETHRPFKEISRLVLPEWLAEDKGLI